MIEISRFPILRHLENIFSKRKIDLWHRPTEVSPGYFAYTRQFDRIVEGGALADVLGAPDHDADDAYRAAAAGFRNSVALLRAQKSRRIGKSVFQLQQALLSDGNNKLVVTLLVDHSGSMRGDGIQLAALFCALVGKMLVEAGAAVELLGFTTSSWRGGKSHGLWLELGGPPMPGRVCDLLHVVHRSASFGMEWCDTCVETMLTPNLLKENVDGEAIIWAEERLLKHESSKRVLVVLSDGAPVDDNTLARNAPSGDDSPILLDHLLSQVSRISSEKKVLLTALGVGIKHRVKNYYGSDLAFANLKELPNAAFGLMSFITARTEAGTSGAN